jgi:hypothetical protein
LPTWTFAKILNVISKERLMMMKLLRPVSLFLTAGAVVGLSAVAKADPIYLQSLVVGQTQSIPADNTPPPSPPAHHREFLFGPEVSVFFPTSAKTADTYGKTWTSIGVGIGSTIHANMRGAFSPFIDVLYNSHDNNQALLIPLGISYRKSLTNGPIAPFVGIQGFVEPVAQSAPEYHLKYGTSVTGGGRVAAGVQFTKYFYIEAAYLESASVRGYDFSGTQIETGLRF